MKNFLERLNEWIYMNTGDFGELLYSLPILILVCIVYILCRVICIKRAHADGKAAFPHEAVQFLLVLWFVVVGFMTLTPTSFWSDLWTICLYGTENSIMAEQIHFSGWQLVPQILDYIVQGHFSWFLASARYIIPHFIENIILFVPLGVLLPLVCNAPSWVAVTLTGFGTSFIIELSQGFFGRDGNIDDLLCNTLGTVAGFLIFMLIRKIFPSFVERCKNYKAINNRKSQKGV